MCHNNIAAKQSEGHEHGKGTKLAGEVENTTKG
uniref:Uncharacterized protein n=1 Tax=Arundo donax TaxID=35708 RepID=A0A0A9GIN9_ARUDO